MKVVCKFRCDHVIQAEHSKGFVFHAVSGNSEENKEFWKYTPSGKLEFQCVNPNVNFEPGKEYMLEISLVDKE